MTFQRKSASRNSDSFDTQRDIIINIVYQRFEGPDESQNTIGHLSSKPDMRPAGRRNAQSKKGSHGRKKETIGRTPCHNSPDGPKHQKSRQVVADPNENTRNYVRPAGPELVSPRHPSCSGLPPTWDYTHDRFIAYLATHAPLDSNGRVPRHEEKKERWRPEEIARLLEKRFPRLASEGGIIKVSIVEKRLALLDEAGDNDYFQMQYGAYMYEEWGQGI